MDSPTSLFRSTLLGHWPKVKHNSFRFRCALHHLSLPIIEDRYFKDKDVQATRAILEEQKEKPDHIDYEVTVYMGTFFLLLFFF
jgi:hypothetical protein